MRNGYGGDPYDADGCRPIDSLADDCRPNEFVADDRRPGLTGACGFDGSDAADLDMSDGAVDGACVNAVLCNGTHTSTDDMQKDI